MHCRCHRCGRRVDAAQAERRYRDRDGYDLPVDLCPRCAARHDRRRRRAVAAVVALLLAALLAVLFFAFVAP
jgi:hypothetical protein